MPQRNISLDIVKLMLAFFVVGIHTNFLGDVSDIAEYLTVNGFFRIAVPIFLLINGFYFNRAVCEKRVTRWFKRAIVLYVFWMLVYGYYWLIPKEVSFSEILLILHTAVIGYHHLWYISGMIGAGFLVYLLRNMEVKPLLALVIIAFLTGVAIQYAGNYHLYKGTVYDGLFNHYWFHRNFLFFCFPFFCLGYLIDKFNVHNKIAYGHAWIAGGCGIVLLLAESYLNFIAPNRDGGFDNFMTLFFTAPALFIIAVKTNVTGQTKIIGLYATAIYLTHSFILDKCRMMTGLDNTWLTVLGCALSFIAATAVILLHRRLKFIL